MTAAAFSGISVVLVDPLATVRAGLELLLSSQPDIEVLAVAGTADEAMSKVMKLRRRTGFLVIVGVGLPGEHDAYWLITALRERFPTITIVACGANADKPRISRALFVGADGYVDKNAEPDEFLEAVRRSAQGEVVMVGPPQEWIGPISDQMQKRRDSDSVLSEREIEVLTLAAEGLTARQIAVRLGLKERTVTTHFSRIYSKLGVGTRIAAISAASRAGMITPPSPSGS